MKRTSSTDALRGLAVILMVVQHLGAWFWRGSLGADGRMLAEHPVIFSLSGLGGMAAPIFITLAGVGAWYLCQREKGARTPLARGVTILLLGYALNLAAHRWFSPGSWYVLHMIGFGLLLSPLLVRIPARGLVSLAFLVVLLTPLVQYGLGTRLAIGTQELSNHAKPFGPLRLALAEGHFPVFPWLAFFMNGVVVARWVEARDETAPWRLAWVYVLAGIAFTLVGAAGFSWASTGALKRFFLLRASFYPGFPPVLFTLQGMALLAFASFRRIEQRRTFQFPSALVCLGRASLSVLFVHILLLRELGIVLGYRKVFSEPATLAITFVALLAFGYLAVQWQRIGYRFGLEWLLRRIAPGRAGGQRRA